MKLNFQDEIDQLSRLSETYKDAEIFAQKLQDDNLSIGDLLVLKDKIQLTLETIEKAIRKYNAYIIRRGVEKYGMVPVWYVSSPLSYYIDQGILEDIKKEECSEAMNNA